MEERENRQQWMIILFFTFLVSCILGWIYEMGFYRINDGYFVKRGQGFGPWLPIYGVGASAITILLYQFKSKPAIVFTGNSVVAGILEFLVGWALFHFCNGLRLWDYNTEIWNWGNIGGYVCLRSVLGFGFAGTFCIYVIVPTVYELTRKVQRVILIAMTVLMGLIFSADIVVGYMIKPVMKVLCLL